MSGPRIFDEGSFLVYSASDRARFWSKVVFVAGGCAEWRGAAQAGGYGNFYHDGRLKRATHVAWELAYGPLPEVPTADFRGTCVILRAEDHPRAKLAPEDVAVIRTSSRSQRALARIYGVSKSQIGNIKRGEQWGRRSQWPEVPHG